MIAMTRKSAAVAHKEWTRSTSTAESIGRLVEMGLLTVTTIGGWRPPKGEEYPKPHDDELVVFEAYYPKGFGVSVHPFLGALLSYYATSLYNLHPNSVLSVAIFIHMCEGYLGVYPYFNLFRHFFCVKAKGVPGGSQIARGVYINLRDGMKVQYLSIPLKSLMRDLVPKMVLRAAGGGMAYVVRCHFHPQDQRELVGAPKRGGDAGGKSHSIVLHSDLFNCAPKVFVECLS